MEKVMGINEDLNKLIGNLPLESGFKKRMRFHQAWWRAFVLVEEPGIYPVRKNETIGNTILNGRIDCKNFLSQNIIDAVEETIQDRKTAKSGIIEEDRLFNNLLSSQPLCFNFFGELKSDPVLALKILRRFYPELTEVVRIKFEFATDEKYTTDNSAFDVAFEVMAGEKKGLLGIECKYTDSFSPKEYDKQEYLHIYNENKGGTFVAPYKNFITSKFNQLFRNQLIGEALVQNKRYDFVLTGLFCHQSDTEAQNTAVEFQSMLKDGQSKFRVITYQAYLANLQQLELSWEQRELSMLLWARYCGMKLSESALMKIDIKLQ
jgi:hypothetical protein